jgi:hypothetical protein
MKFIVLFALDNHTSGRPPFVLVVKNLHTKVYEPVVEAFKSYCLKNHRVR